MATDLADLDWYQLTKLAERGEITWEAARDLTHERFLRRFGGVDPYAHLLASGADGIPRRRPGALDRG